VVTALAEPAAAQFPLFQQPGQPGALLDPQALEQPWRAPLTITRPRWRLRPPELLARRTLIQFGYPIRFN
jgi:hypothetical protein